MNQVSKPDEIMDEFENIMAGNSELSIEDVIADIITDILEQVRQADPTNGSQMFADLDQYVQQYQDRLYPEG